MGRADEPKMRRPRELGGVLTFTLIGILVSATPGIAQELPIETSPGSSRPMIRSEPSKPSVTDARPLDVGAYPGDVGVRHRPAFVEPFAARYETRAARGRFGLSGWTAPAGPPNGARDISGWFSLGFSLTWEEPR